MAYTKQNFRNGQVLTADHLNRIENGLVAVNNTLSGLAGGSPGEARCLTDRGKKTNFAMVSFTDDDCRKEVYYRVDSSKPSLFEIIQEYNIPYTLACPPGNIRPTGNPKDDPNDDKYLTWTDVRAMYNAGVDIACHHWRQYNMDDTGYFPTIDSYAADLQQCMDKFAEQNIEVQGVAYPQGKYVMDYIPAVKNHYHFGVTVDRGINQIPYATYYLNRCEVFPTGSAYVNDTTLALKEAKARVDDVAENGGWLIFMTHAWYETFSPTDLGTLIEYIRSQGIEIVSISDALKATGNIVEVGNFKKPVEDLTNPYFVIGANGECWANGIHIAGSDSNGGGSTEKFTTVTVTYNTGVYLKPAGGQQDHDDTNRIASLPITVQPGEVYRLTCAAVWGGLPYCVYNSAEGVSPPTIATSYDPDGDGTYGVENTAQGEVLTDYEVVIPEGATYMRVSSNLSEDVQPGGYVIKKRVEG